MVSRIIPTPQLGAITSQEKFKNGITKELIKLSTAVNNLFKLSLNAFAKKDFELAEKVRNEDIDIDKLYKGFFNSLLEKSDLFKSNERYNS